MARMLGRAWGPKGHVRADCCATDLYWSLWKSGGKRGTVRAQRRREGRAVAREIGAALGQPVFDPFVDLSDCIHGCNGSPCTAESCTFTCHEG